MISLNKSNQKNTFFNVSTLICECAAVQSGHPKSPACTKDNLKRMSLWKKKVNSSILIMLVIQYDNSHLNLKSEDLSSNTFVETKTEEHRTTS